MRRYNFRLCKLDLLFRLIRKTAFDICDYWNYTTIWVVIWNWFESASLSVRLESVWIYRRIFSFLGKNFGSKTKNLCIECFDVGHRLNESRQNLDSSICDLRHHTLLHREVFGSSRELGVFNATSSSHVAKLSSDVLNCFVAIYVCADF